ncbi:lipase 3-like [Camponotus floridanus]|uniref:lipase 3-like n=1 Tax=Camponotus floridanus TaxID=104421 RepID=UPI000DC67D26|nr:lipase 3-like [Camponotus floridanus]
MHLCGILSPDEYAAPVRDCTIRPAEHTTPEMCSRCRPAEIRLTFAALANVIPQLSSLLKRIIWTIWSKTEFNSDIVVNTPEMIRKAGYPVEAHVIMTEDGYFLTLHRIPGGNDSLPVLLLHGLTASSFKWLIPSKDKAFPYLLANQGYDVWLGNFRGTTYSKAHISLSPSNSAFWDFSFNEIGIYDVSAMVTFITNLRSQPLHTCIGHSMGTTCFYIMASERPEIARMVKMMINFGPVVFLSHMQSSIRFLVPIRRMIKIKFLNCYLIQRNKNKVNNILRLFFHGKFLQSDYVIAISAGLHRLHISGVVCSAGAVPHWSCVFVWA